MELLLRVEGSWTLRARGVVVEPHLPIERATGRTIAVRLRTPDGGVRDAEAIVEIAHVHAPAVPPERRAWGALVVRGVTVDDVPAGTEIYLVTARDS